MHRSIQKSQLFLWCFKEN